MWEILTILAIIAAIVGGIIGLRLIKALLG